MTEEREEPDSVTFQTGVLMGLARVYDALLTLIAQSDDDTAAMLQDAHAKGYYLFPGFTREEDTEEN